MQGLEPPPSAQPCCPHLANPPAGCCPPPPPPPVLDEAYLPAQYLPEQAAIDLERAAAIDLERAQHGTTTGPVVDESIKNDVGLPSSDEEKCTPVYPDLLQEAINNPNGCLYENRELETSLPHLPIERASSLDSIPDEGKCGGDIESGEPQTSSTKGAAMRRRSSVYVREEVSKWKSLDTWRLWGISIWSEFLGTFLLVFIGCGIVVKGESTAVVALGFFLAVLIVIEAFVPFSGAQFNPVVSLVMCLCGVISPSLMLLHIVIQFVAGIAAAFMMKALIPGTAAADCAVAKVNPDWHDGIGLFRAVCLEAFMTAVLIYVVLNAGFHKKSRARNALSTFAVASTVAALVIIGGDLTGTSINPARSLGPALACNYWDYQWVYFVGPPVGGVLAWVVYAVTHHRSQR